MPAGADDTDLLTAPGLEVTDHSARGAGPGVITVDWRDPDTIPGAPAVTGYTVRAFSDDGVTEIIKRLADTAATQETTTLTGLVPDGTYRIEVAARNEVGTGAPAVLSRVKAASHIVPTATATTLRRANADGKYAPLVTNVNGDFGVHLDPVAGLTPTAEIHYTTDGSAPGLHSRVFVPGVGPSIQIRQDTTVRWIVKDSGNVVGPQGQRFFDVVESPNPAPEVLEAAAAVVSGAVDVTWTKLPADGEHPVTGYRVQAYTGSSDDVATGIRVGEPIMVAQPTDPAATVVVRRVPGLTNGAEYRFTVAARYGTVFSNESALSAAAAPMAPAGANAGPDQSVRRGALVMLDGSTSQRATSYQWTQLRPRTTQPDGSTYQDPLLSLTGATTATPSFRFPTKSSAASDDNAFLLRLTTSHTDADGTSFTRSDLVEVTQQADGLAATRTRWRAGDELVGTGTQEGAHLSFHSGSHAGPVVATVTVRDGAWTVPGNDDQPAGGVLHVWSDHGFVGEIAVTP